MWRPRAGFLALVILTVGCGGWVVSLVGGGGEPSESMRSGNIARSIRGDAEPPRTKLPTTAESSRSMRVKLRPERAQTAEVTDHVDGDTLRLTATSGSGPLVVGTEITVRLLEIDTPESVDPSSPDQCYASRASRRLQQLAPLGSEVSVVADKELLDPYGRTLLYVWNAHGVFVNLDMVNRGLAKAVLYEPNDAYINLLRKAEASARAAGVGLWGECEYFGEPVGLMSNARPSPKPARTPPPTSTDPRFPYCSDANDAGYGNYVNGRDPEYEWYDDRDSDGIVCEF